MASGSRPALMVLVHSIEATPCPPLCPPGSQGSNLSVWWWAPLSHTETSRDFFIFILCQEDWGKVWDSIRRWRVFKRLGITINVQSALVNVVLSFSPSEYKPYESRTWVWLIYTFLRHVTDLAVKRHSLTVRWSMTNYDDDQGHLVQVTFLIVAKYKPSYSFMHIPKCMCLLYPELKHVLTFVKL